MKKTYVKPNTNTFAATAGQLMAGSGNGLASGDNNPVAVDNQSTNNAFNPNSNSSKGTRFWDYDEEEEAFTDKY